eukprot:CAMPEP_0171286290 /NCGR_PEP_ID=MMETSP0790-20130122/68937_1 /TAXON_ID=2925 /ORGANISM="Alexandrium catenella, Strain OF101" /LENGTH=44 /DNA_ID= /DNA_START= /DNA_END= /DNA_ORIENTATION=
MSVTSDSETPRLLDVYLMRSPRAPSSPWQQGMTAKSTPALMQAR